MIETIYKVSCDNCKERSQQNGMLLLRDFVRVILKIGWQRIDGAWHCPFCVRSLSVLCPPKVRKDPPRRSKLSKTVREALQQRLIDEGEDHEA